jgi:hypothetical protein
LQGASPEKRALDQVCALSHFEWRISEISRDIWDMGVFAPPFVGRRATLHELIALAARVRKFSEK